MKCKKTPFCENEVRNLKPLKAFCVWENVVVVKTCYFEFNNKITFVLFCYFCYFQFYLVFHFKQYIMSQIGLMELQ